MAAATRSLRASIVVAILTVVFGAIGAATAGAVGAAWGLTAALALGLSAWLVEYWRGLVEIAKTS